MEILILAGSPRRNSNSNQLVKQFVQGAQERGHKVFLFDAAHANVHPCIACNKCGMDGPCIFKDDFEIVREHLIPADMVVFATPMYYFGISAQLKTVIDRFYAINGKIHGRKKSALLMTYADTATRKAEPIGTYFDVLWKYLGWQESGRIIAPGVWIEGDISHTSYLGQALELGRSLE